ncbi:hypothetical protein BX600DRAFT_544497 [Xylariales sp. PMI_506]|nr:hypothetical protein BX600DRAFT_544497 [Xylariales sp. PMI_506]
MKLAALILVALTFLQSHFALAQFPLVNLTAATMANLTSTCQDVLAEDVTCDPALIWVMQAARSRFYIFNSSILTEVCTTTCSASLAAQLRRISGACGTGTITFTSGTQLYPAWFAEQALELYDQACLTDPSGNFCSPEVGELVGIDPANQQFTTTVTATDAAFECNSCFLSLMSTRLEQPLASNDGLSYMYSSITSSCNITSMAITPIPTTTTWSITPTTSSTTSPTCSGTEYHVQPSDTCYSVSMSQGISTIDLLTANDLQAYCANFPTSGTLCIPSSSVCTPYTVQAGDTCVSIAQSLAILTSFAQIVSWNPEVGGSCDNIVNMMESVICVSNPGGTWINPSSSSATTSSTSTNTIHMTPFSMFPSQTTIVAANYTIIPWANGTRTDCQYYLDPPVLTNQSTNTTSFLCTDAALAYGITLNELLEWNPSLPSGSSCTMDSGEQYCVGTYITQANATATCVEYELTVPGYDCYTFSNLYGVDYSQFLLWNPEVGDNCENFAMGTEYCVAVYGYKQPGIISTCNLFVTANDTNWIDQPCQIIETEYGISHLRFVAWNPVVQDNCTGLYLGYDYCVSIPNYKPTYTTTATTWPTPTLPTGTATATTTTTTTGS